MDDQVQVLLGGAILLAGLGLAFLISRIAAYWKSKKDSLLTAACTSDKLENAKWLQYLLKHVFNVVDNVVNALNDTYKKDILSATSDGKLSDEEKKLLRDKAVELVKVEIPNTAWNELSVIIGDVEETLKTLIEDSVSAQKKGTTLSATVNNATVDELTEEMANTVLTENTTK